MDNKFKTTLPEDFVANEEPEKQAPEIQGRMPGTHGPLTDDLISPEDARSYVENDLENQGLSALQPADELDGYGNRLVHEGTWTQKPAESLNEEDIAETHDWRSKSVEADPPADEREAWTNEKTPE